MPRATKTNPPAETPATPQDPTQPAPEVSQAPTLAEVQASQPSQAPEAVAAPADLAHLVEKPKRAPGPEDALGLEPTQHDYTGLVGDANYRPHISMAITDPETGEVSTQLVPQIQIVNPA